MSARSDRLSLRPAGPEDAEACFASIEVSREALKADTDWAAGVTGPDAVRSFYAGANGRREFTLAGPDGAHLGGAGFDGEGACKLSLWVRSDERGKGLGTEAVRLACALAFSELGAHKVFARIDPANRASRKVLMKAGFKYEGCLRAEKKLGGKWVNQECWGLLASEAKR